MVYIVGISAYYHDSSACIIRDGEIVAAAQEERFSRVKHDDRFPARALGYCLTEAGVTIDDVEHFVFYDKPLPKFERLLESYIAFAPKGIKSFATALPIWLKDKLFQKSNIEKELLKFKPTSVIKDKLLFSEHHLSHAASAFYPSPFDSAAVITLDGVGEWSSTSIAIGKSADLRILREIHYPHSLGLLYSAFTYFTGFRVNSGEYKLMGLAPYGEARFVDIIKDNLIQLNPDGSFALNMDYFSYCTDLRMTNSKFADLFGGPERRSGEKISQREMDMAKSVQLVLEECILNIATAAKNETGEKNLCLAGGVALNCVANTALAKTKLFENMWVQPASGDAGGSIGAALAVYHLKLGTKRSSAKIQTSLMKGCYLGPRFDNDEVVLRLENIGANYEVLSNEKVIEEVANLLADGQPVAWMNGRMEFGPRALGGRSILADPRRLEVQRSLNLQVKYRESFRPFAPSVLEAEAHKWFNLTQPKSPFMLFIGDVIVERRLQQAKEITGLDLVNMARSDVPAITHVDYSARVQTVGDEANSNFRALISKFYKITNCPMLVNTSFNIRGEPIVCTPEDAFRCFMSTDLEYLVIENCLIRKSEQPSLSNVASQQIFGVD